MKKVLAVFLCLLAFVVLLCPVACAASGDTTVYITRTGERYHDAGCRYLSKSCIEITLQAAVDGGYTPCKVCHPPTLDVAAAFTLPPRPTYSPAPSVSRAPLPTPQPTRAPAQSDTQASVVESSTNSAEVTSTILVIALIAGSIIYALYDNRKFEKELARIRGQRPAAQPVSVVKPIAPPAVVKPNVPLSAEFPEHNALYNKCRELMIDYKVIGSSSVSSAVEGRANRYYAAHAPMTRESIDYVACIIVSNALYVELISCKHVRPDGSLDLEGHCYLSGLNWLRKRMVLSGYLTRERSDNLMKVVINTLYENLPNNEREKMISEIAYGRH